MFISLGVDPLDKRKHWKNNLLAHEFESLLILWIHWFWIFYLTPILGSRSRIVAYVILYAFFITYCHTIALSAVIFALWIYFIGILFLNYIPTLDRSHDHPTELWYRISANPFPLAIARTRQPSLQFSVFLHPFFFSCSRVECCASIFGRFTELALPKSTNQPLSSK